MFIALLWKEFREHVWKMGSLAFILIAMLVWTTHVSRNSMTYRAWANVWYGAAWFAPVWIAAFTLSGEAGGRTELTLAVLPVSRRWLFAMKIAWGIAAFTVPLLLTLWLGREDLKKNEWPLMFGLLVGSVTLYGLILLVGMRVTREGLAAAVGMIVLLASGLLFVIAEDAGSRGSYLLREMLNVVNPFGLFVVISNGLGEQTISVRGFAAIQAIVIIAYFGIAWWRYNRSFPRTLAFSPQDHAALLHPSASVRLARFRHPLIWKETREQFSIIALAAMAGFIGAFVIWIPSHGPLPAHRVNEIIRLVLIVLFVVGTCVPTIAAMVLGIAGVAADVEEKSHAFWRSRPISAAQLFWNKYAVGLAGLVVLAAFFEVPYVAARGNLFNGWDDSFDLQVGNVMLGQLVWLPMVLAMTMFFATILRRALYAVVAVVALMLVALLYPSGEHRILLDSLFHPTSVTEMVVAKSITLLLAVVFSLLAQVALQRRWRMG